MSIDYEWTAEREDEHGDIVDNHFAPNLKELIRYYPHSFGERDSIALVQTRGEDARGGYGRTWAYITEEGELPVEFDDGGYIPKRYRDHAKVWETTLREAMKAKREKAAQS